MFDIYLTLHLGKVKCQIHYLIWFSKYGPYNKCDLDQCSLKGIYPEFQVIRGFSQKILADLLSYDQIHS